jgi:hypothetical protein
MPSTVQALIEAAYSRSTANDPGKLAIDLELIGRLDRTYQRMYAELAVASGDNNLTSTVLTFSGTPASAALPTDVIDVVRVEVTSTGAKGYLIPASEKDRAWHLAPAVYRQGSALISRGKAGDPVFGTQLTAYILDAPTALTSLASVLDPRWLHRYDSILIDDLALYLSDKDVNRNPADYQNLRTDLTDAMNAFNALVSNSNSAKETPHNGRTSAASQTK